MQTALETSARKIDASAADGLMSRLKYINENKYDAVVPVKEMAMLPDGRFGFKESLAPPKFVHINPFAQTRLASYCEIPNQYLQRLMTEDVRLAALNVNHGLATKAEDKRLLRCLDGNLRSVLSSRYFICDGYDILSRVLPLIEAKGFRVIKAEVTETKIYMDVISDVITSDIKRGDTVAFGITIQTSDLGNGTISIELYAHRAACDNGLILPSSVKRRHTGKEIDTEYLSDRTMAKETDAFLSRTHDTVAGLLAESNFQKEVARLQLAAKTEIEKPMDCTERAAKVLGITNPKFIDRATELFIGGNEGAGLTQWGLINSFTGAAKELSDYDQAVDMQRAAGQILTLSAANWKQISVGVEA